MKEGRGVGKAKGTCVQRPNRGGHPVLGGRPSEWPSRGCPVPGAGRWCSGVVEADAWHRCFVSP